METFRRARLPKGRWLTLLFAIVFLAPSMYGFVTKFLEFVHTFRHTSDGVFAITPMVNYLLASLGFLCMLAWASWNGMFRDIEQPKYDMLNTESALDRNRGDRFRRGMPPEPGSP